MARESKEALSFSKTVAADGSGTLSKELSREATVEHVQSRIYPGPQLDLELKIYVVTTEGTRRSIIEPEGKDHIDGDNDFYEWFPSEPVHDDEEIVVEWVNQDGANEYDFRVNMSVDFLGGIDRAIRSLRGSI